MPIPYEVWKNLPTDVRCDLVCARQHGEVPFLQAVDHYRTLGIIPAAPVPVMVQMELF